PLDPTRGRSLFTPATTPFTVGQHPCLGRAPRDSLEPWDGDPGARFGCVPLKSCVVRRAHGSDLLCSSVGWAAPRPSHSFGADRSGTSRRRLAHHIAVVLLTRPAFRARGVQPSCSSWLGRYAYRLELGAEV